MQSKWIGLRASVAKKAGISVIGSATILCQRSGNSCGPFLRSSPLTAIAWLAMIYTRVLNKEGYGFSSPIEGL